MRAILLCTLVLLAAAACKKDDPAPKKAEPAEPATPEVDPDRKEAYVKAAIRIACAGRNIADNAKLAAEVARVQKEAGFDAKSWSAMALQVARDPGATQRISEGAAACD